MPRRLHIGAFLFAAVSAGCGSSATPLVSDEIVGQSQQALSAGRVVAYVDGTTGSINVAGLDANKYTHINYAFADLDAGGNVISHFGAQDDNNINALKSLKNTNPNLKIMISVGGWTWSNNFSVVAGDATLRANMVNSAYNYVTSRGVDGIDIDWEWPGWQGEGDNGVCAGTCDGQRLQTLMKDLWNKFNPNGKLVSMAGGSSPQMGTNVDLGNGTTGLGPYVSHLNIMTYDFHGNWECSTAHQANVYGGSISIDSTVNMYLGEGFPANKLVVGIPFYGRGWNGATALGQAASCGYGEDSVLFKNVSCSGTGEGASCSVSGVGGYVLHHDTAAQASYLSGNNRFVSIDNLTTIGWKTAYINNRSLGGAMYWSALQDNAARDLTNRIWSDIGGVSACVPESDASFCSGRGKNCGNVTDADNCGNNRTVNCGSCTSPQTCGGGGTANVCGGGSCSLSPYNGTHALPGTVQAEDFDNGGAGCAYSDTDAVNAGGGYRTADQVDLEACTDTGGGFNVGWTAAGEWLKYTVSVTAGTYSLNFRVASTAGVTNAFHLENESGTNLTGAMSVPNTGGWQTWQTVTKTGVALAGGSHVYKIVVDAAGFNLNNFSVSGASCTPESDSSFCSRLGKNCGTVTANDNCGTSRTVSSCGACTSPQTCGGGGTANVCGGGTSGPDRTEGGTASGTGTACNSSTEDVTKLYDNLMTSASFSKWCVAASPSTTTPISTMYDFSGTTTYTVTSYTITTGNDAAGRDPKDWTFQGCQGSCTAGSDTGWVTLDTRTGQFAGAARYQTNTYAFSNGTAYQQFRLRVTANNGDTGTFQMAELQMFGNAGSSCTPESDSAFCSRLAKNCGSVTANDNCGTSRTVSSCGSCTSPQTCGGGGTANVCGGGGGASCWAAYAQGNCNTYVQGTQVSSGGHNWTCSNGNCANCAGYASCAPGGSGCPWGVVWTDNGVCN